MMKLVAAAMVAIALSAIPASAATWSLVIEVWPAVNPTVPNSGFQDMKQLVIGNYAQQATCNTVSAEITTNPTFTTAPVPSNQWGLAWAFCVQTSP